MARKPKQLPELAWLAPRMSASRVVSLASFLALALLLGINTLFFADLHGERAGREEAEPRADPLQHALVGGIHPEHRLVTQAGLTRAARALQHFTVVVEEGGAVRHEVGQRRRSGSARVPDRPNQREGHGTEGCNDHQLPE